jgi:hypothetical protein
MARKPVNDVPFLAAKFVLPGRSCNGDAPMTIKAVSSEVKDRRLMSALS